MRWGVLGLVLLSVLPSTAEAREEWGRRAGGHLFLAPLRFDAAFVQPELALAQGGAYEKLPNFQGDGGTFNLELAGVRAGFGAEVVVAHPVSLYGRAELEGVAGVNGKSTLFRGLVADFNWRAGVGLEIIRTRAVVLGARVAVVGLEGQQVDPANLIDQLIQHPQATLAQVVDAKLASLLLVRRSKLGGAGDLLFAWGISPWFGLQLGSDLVVAHSVVHTNTANGGTDTTGTGVDLALGAALDIGPPTSPIAGIVEVDHRRSLSGGGAITTDPTTSLGLGLYYRHREALEFGVSLVQELGGDDSQEQTSAELSMRYYF